MGANNKTIISKTPSDLGNPQANWDRKKFDDFVTDKGYKCYIERALRCPCNNQPTGQGLSDCMNCSGSGWFLIDKQESIIACSSMSHRNKFEVWSQANMGIVNISTRPQDKLGFMDRVTLIELESWFSQTFQLRQSTTDATKYFSFLIYNPIEIYEVYIYIDSNSPLLYVGSANYTISGNKILINKTFIDGLGLDQQPSITIRFTHNPTYHIIDINRDLIKQRSISDVQNEVVNFPLNCIGKRAHYVLESPAFNGDSVFDNTNYNRPLIKYDY